MKKAYVALLSVLALAACSSTNEKMDLAPGCPPPVSRETKFNIDQYKPFEGSGSARINGRLCVKTETNKTKCLSNQLVVVNPVTDYSTEWYEKHWMGGVRLDAPDPMALNFNRTAKTDANGYFTFTHLPAGSYYVGAEICLPCINGKEPKVKYQRLGTKVTVKKVVKANLKPGFKP